MEEYFQMSFQIIMVSQKKFENTPSLVITGHQFKCCYVLLQLLYALYPRLNQWKQMERARKKRENKEGENKVDQASRIKLSAKTDPFSFN